MPDNPNLTPPPEEPMSEAARAEIRQRLAAAAAGGGAQRRSRRWVVPALAAAAVVAVVVGAYAVVAPGDDGTGGSGDSLQPAGTTTDVPGTPPPDEPMPDTPPPDYPEPDQTLIPTMPPTGPEGTGSTPPPPDCIPDPNDPGPCEADQEQPGTCAEELDLLDQPGVRGATVTAERGYGPGTTYLYETKSAWIVCDDLAAIDGGAPTLLALHDKAQRYEPDTSTLVISSNTMSNPDSSQGFDQFFAAGRDFDGVQAISYTFPDGHTEEAVVGENGLWSMVYLPTDGVLVDPHQNQMNLDPITVEVDYTTGPNRTFELRWGYDTCGQINHGC